MKAYRMTYHSQKRGTIRIVTMGKDMADAQAQAVSWADETSRATGEEEEIELVQVTKLNCEWVKIDTKIV